MTGYINFQTRQIFLAFALLAVLLRGLVPAGYMPDFAAHPGALMALRVCTGDGYATIHVAADKYGKTAPKHSGHQTTLCDYAINHVFSPVGGHATSIEILIFLSLTLFTFSGFDFSQRRYFGAMAARAPPVCA